MTTALLVLILALEVLSVVRERRLHRAMQVWVLCTIESPATARRVAEKFGLVPTPPER